MPRTLKILGQELPTIREFGSFRACSFSGSVQEDVELGKAASEREAEVLPTKVFSVKKCVLVSLATVSLVILIIASVYLITKSGKKPHGKLPPAPPSDLPKGLALALRFYDAQKSGKLPPTNPVPWRGDSFLTDHINDIDLTGGYFDAGDTLKFTFPMAWSMTVMGWAFSTFEGSFNSTNTLAHGREQLRWGTDWLLKTWLLPDGIVTLVGDPVTDHTFCWSKPEEFNQSRPAFSVGVSAGTDVIMEVVAALAAASKAFNESDPEYANRLITRAKEMYAAALASPTKGTYTTVTTEAAHYYSSDHYDDEVQWASTWMYLATAEDAYLENALNQTVGNAIGLAPSVFFSWQNKRFGARVLLAMLPQKAYQANKGAIDNIRAELEKSMCMLLPSSPTTSSAPRTKGGMLFLDSWGPIQYAASTAFLADVYGRFMNESALNLTCQDMHFAGNDLRSYAKSQVDYILGDNPLRMSYMVGYGDKYPQQIHHRAASIPMGVSTAKDCFVRGGNKFYWEGRNAPNPNILYGAVSGGPAKDDSYKDRRDSYKSGEPSLSTNAPFIAALASMIAGQSTGPENSTHG